MNTPANREAALLPAVGERALIERIRKRLPPSDLLLVSAGDDAAVAKPERGTLLVLTTDALVEDVHFTRRFSTLADVGYKALAVNVSDVAAMGGKPAHALLSLMLPDATSLGDIDALLDGVLAMAAEERVTIAGGNVTRSPGPLIVDVALIGSVKPRKVLTRAGGRPGDSLYVTGSIGAAAAGLDWLREAARGPSDEPAEPLLAECVRKYRRPQARARIGSLAGRTRAANACMDLSDGLADGVRQIAEASGTGAEIDASRLPMHPAARVWFTGKRVDPIQSSLTAGDDYELLFAVGPRARRRWRVIEQQARGVPITCIGRLTPDGQVTLRRDGAPEPLPQGFSHF